MPAPAFEPRPARKSELRLCLNSELHRGGREAAPSKYRSSIRHQREPALSEVTVDWRAKLRPVDLLGQLARAELDHLAALNRAILAAREPEPVDGVLRPDDPVLRPACAL